MIKISFKSLTQSHIDNLTLISKQSLKYRKHQASTANFFTEELQLIINTSCRQILGNFFRKWAVFAINAGHRKGRRDNGVGALFRVLEGKVKEYKWEVLMKLHLY